eukprot:TRINITY_DN2688_c0_g1_i1.p1 TRINITY_DN2688_c0_g1~~TRINITY_DN2688_c0_g1_i1.p1  ORF type:complete len:65 (-),score=8.74 TRINITY_DN2688_c0_g1_i1:5-199(-)
MGGGGPTQCRQRKHTPLLWDAQMNAEFHFKDECNPFGRHQTLSLLWNRFVLLIIQVSGIPCTLR